MRTYKRKTERGKTPKDVMVQAVDAVINGNQSVRKTALDFQIPRKTLGRYVIKFRQREIRKENQNNGNLQGGATLENYEVEVGYAKYWQVKKFCYSWNQ